MAVGVPALTVMVTHCSLQDKPARKMRKSQRKMTYVEASKWGDARKTKRNCSGRQERGVKGGKGSCKKGAPVGGKVYGSLATSKYYMGHALYERQEYT